MKSLLGSSPAANPCRTQSGNRNISESRCASKGEFTVATYSDESIESAQAMSSEPEPQLVDDDDVTIYRDTDAPGEPFSVLFDIRDHGRFARSKPVGGVMPFSRVVSSMT